MKNGLTLCLKRLNERRVLSEQEPCLAASSRCSAHCKRTVWQIPKVVIQDRAISGRATLERNERVIAYIDEIIPNRGVYNSLPVSRSNARTAY